MAIDLSSVDLSSNLSSFKVSDTDFGNKSGGADNVSTDDLMIKVSSVGAASSLLAGSDKTMSSGVNRMTGGKSIPTFQGQGAKVPNGSSGMLIQNDKKPMHIYGYNTNTSTWQKLKELAAGDKVQYPVGSAFTHESLGSININELYAIDPTATASERGLVRMIPMGGVSSGGYANQFKNSFSTEVQMTGDLDVDGSATLGSWTVEGNLCSNANGTVESANITSDAATLGSWTVAATLGSWTVEGNLCKPVPSVNGTTPSYFQHRDHGIAIPAPDGKLYAIRVGSGGAISTVEVGTYSGVNPSFN
jgi:hypothetical protein